MSQVQGGPHPGANASKLANYINEALLGYPETGFLYFEDGDVMGVPRLDQQLFEYFGNAYRLRLFRPETRPRNWAFLEHILGSAISIDPPRTSATCTFKGSNTDPPASVRTLLGKPGLSDAR